MSMPAILSLAVEGGKEGFRESGMSRRVVQTLREEEEAESGAGCGSDADLDSG